MFTLYYIICVIINTYMMVIGCLFLYNYRPKVSVRPLIGPTKRVGRMPALHLWPWDPFRIPTTMAFRFVNITTCLLRRTAGMVGSLCWPALCATWWWTESRIRSACSSANSLTTIRKAKAKPLGSEVSCRECTSVSVSRYNFVFRTRPFKLSINTAR